MERPPVSTHDTIISFSQLGPSLFRCRSDAAWKEDQAKCGIGWCLFDFADLAIQLGLKSFRKSLSVSHAELQGLVWAMQCMLELNFLCVSFETDCKDLLAITENPEDWPAFHAELRA